MQNLCHKHSTHIPSLGHKGCPLQSVRRAAQAMEVMLHTVEREIPETAAAMRLSSMEMSDAIEEVTLLR